MKLRSKINLYSVVMFIILLLIINGAIYFTFSRMMLDSELQRVTDEAKQTVIGINQANPSIPVDNLLRAYMPVNGMLQIVSSDNNTIKAAISPELSHLKDHPVTFSNSEQKRIVEYDGAPYAFVSVPIIWVDGGIAELQLTESLASTASNLKTLQFVLTAITLLALIPVLLSARLLSNFITAPISSLIKTMKEIQGSGQYKQIELPKQSKDELYQMGDTFNNMMGQLEKNYEKQEQFVSNASHELKTPLTVIEAYADLLKRRGKKAPELFEESVEAIHSEAHRMRGLIEQLLLLAKHDEQWKIEIAEVSLTTLIEDIINSFRAGFQREIYFETKDQISVKTDSQKLKQLLYILMDNARKYSDGPIQLSLRTQHRQVIIEVIDNGIGIPKEELPKIFDRFYRVDQSRARMSGGFGLGLSLAKELAHAIGADLNVNSVEGVGTTAQIWIELSSSH